MPEAIRVLGIHGLGDHRDSPWKEEWTAAVDWTLGSGEDSRPDVSFVEYDPIFEETNLSTFDVMKALYKLGKSGATHAAASRTMPEKGILGARVEWTAGYVVAWVEDDAFRRKVRALLLNTIKKQRPHVLLAHSLGSLISYDALASVARSGDDKLKAAVSGLHLVTLGSQLANPFVLGNLYNGRIQMPPVSKWTHLFNPQDHVFTREVRLPGTPNFKQIVTLFDERGSMANHSALLYLRHDAAMAGLWPVVAADAKQPNMSISVSKVLKLQAKVKPRKPRSKALLVGINDYPNPAQRLSGCVNDCFLMSSLLQERGLSPDGIRLCLNDRATANGIRERLAWLLDDVMPGDNLVFFCSSHGAQVPAYGPDETVDRLDETLVPYDFDWTDANCIKDNEIYSLYSQLPYDTRLLMIFDCCHSGGMHRNGGMRAKGIAPPDDIRHRAMKWDPKTGMWIQRELPKLNSVFSPDEEVENKYFGETGAVSKLGRASALRKTDSKTYQAEKKKEDVPGPYLPVILEACGEGQLAYEYIHGVESYGAFTFSLAQIIRSSPKTLTFDKLEKSLITRLELLGYEQTPCLLGPEDWKNQPLPWV